MKYKNGNRDVFVPSILFQYFDRASCKDYLCAVEVTPQCYNALKENGFLMSKEKAEKWAKEHGFDGITMANSYCGSHDGGYSYKELMLETYWMYQW